MPPARTSSQYPSGKNDGSVVDPELREIVVRFDRPVREGDCGAWCRGVVPLFVDGRPTTTQLPPAPVTAHMLDAAGTTLRITVALERGQEYSFQLNTPKGDGFRTADGVPLEAYPIRFRTQSEQRGGVTESSCSTRSTWPSGSGGARR